MRTLAHAHTHTPHTHTLPPHNNCKLFTYWPMVYTSSVTTEGASGLPVTPHQPPPIAPLESKLPLPCYKSKKYVLPPKKSTVKPK